MLLGLGAPGGGQGAAVEVLELRGVAGFVYVGNRVYVIILAMGV